MGAPSGVGSGAGWATRHGLSWRHQQQPSSEGGRSGQKADTSAQRDDREALGRSRGGFGTKACVIADAVGRAVGFSLAPGQAHELPLAPLLLAFLSIIPQWIVPHPRYASHAL